MGSTLCLTLETTKRQKSNSLDHHTALGLDMCILRLLSFHSPSPLYFLQKQEKSQSSASHSPFPKQPGTVGSETLPSM